MKLPLNHHENTLIEPPKMIAAGLMPTLLKGRPSKVARIFAFGR